MKNGRVTCLMFAIIGTHAGAPRAIQLPDGELDFL
jgi:hypothetical protein